jgi:hypothetical protein
MDMNNATQPEKYPKVGDTFVVNVTAETRTVASLLERSVVLDPEISHRWGVVADDGELYVLRPGSTDGSTEFTGSRFAAAKESG